MATLLGDDLAVHDRGRVTGGLDDEPTLAVREVVHVLRVARLQRLGVEHVDVGEVAGFECSAFDETEDRGRFGGQLVHGGLEGDGLEITERVALNPLPTEENLKYLQTKRDRMGHLLDLPDSPA